MKVHTKRSLNRLTFLFSIGLICCSIWAGTAHLQDNRTAVGGGETIYALTTGGQLFSFDSTTPGTTSPLISITGITQGQALVGLDFRPANGQLYALGYDPATGLSQLYSVNTNTAVAAPAGASFNLPISITTDEFAFDFNPVVDRARIIAGVNNYRLDPNNGVLSTDTPLTYDAAGPHGNFSPRVRGVAYTNNFSGAAQTTLYAFDCRFNELDTLGSINGSPQSPNLGVLYTVGNSGVFTTNDLVGMDISGATGIAYLKLNTGIIAGRPESAAAGNNRLYTQNLATGAVAEVGQIGQPLLDISISDITVAPPPAPTPTPTPTPTPQGTARVVINSISSEPSFVNQPYVMQWEIIANIQGGPGTKPEGPDPLIFPTGSFFATDGAGATCTVPVVVNVNVYSCQLTSTVIGGKWMVVTYSGDSNYGPASSVAVLHNIVANPGVGYEGDINTPAGGVIGTGDGDVTVADVTIAGRVLRGEICPTAANPNFQQKFDAGPRNTLGDGSRGGSDVDAIDAYSRHDSTTDANLVLAGWQPTPAGGPASISNLGCTPTSRMEDIARPAPDPNAAMRVVRIVPADAGDNRRRVVVLDIEMDADGTEAGTQFSLSWDASKAMLSSINGVGVNPDVALGENVPEGTRLNVNAENVAEGKVGIVESFTAARSEVTLTSGTRRIVRLTLHVADGETFSASDIRFTDDVVRRQTVDSIGQDLDVPGGYGEPASDDKTLSVGRPASIIADQGE